MMMRMRMRIIIIIRHATSEIDPKSIVHHNHDICIVSEYIKNNRAKTCYRCRGRCVRIVNEHSFIPFFEGNEGDNDDASSPAALRCCDNCCCKINSFWYWRTNSGKQALKIGSLQFSAKLMAANFRFCASVVVMLPSVGVDSFMNE